MRKNSFREKKYYHLNLEFQTHPLFKQLDWVFIQKKIKSVSHAYQICIHALVMLDTHVHILMSTDNSKENFFCEHFRAELNPYANLDCFCEPVTNYSQYLNAYKYLYRNPVEAGLCERAEDYPYSTIRILMGKAVGYVEVDDQLGIIQNPIKILRWLNEKIDFKESQLMLLRQDNSLST